MTYRSLATETNIKMVCTDFKTFRKYKNMLSQFENEKKKKQFIYWSVSFEGARDEI